MTKEALTQALKQKPDLAEYAALAAADQTLVPLLFDLIEQDKTAVKYHCEKIIRKISQAAPCLLYPYFERMAALLESGNKFIRLGFLLSLPNLFADDTENKWANIKDTYLSFLHADAVSAFGNAVTCVPKILLKHPDLENEIILTLLNIDSHTFLHKGKPSPECTNVAKGHILDCFDQIFDRSGCRQEMLAFARSNTDNPRNGVRSKAKKFLKNHNAAYVDKAI